MDIKIYNAGEHQYNLIVEPPGSEKSLMQILEIIPPDGAREECTEYVIWVIGMDHGWVIPKELAINLSKEIFGDGGI